MAEAFPPVSHKNMPHAETARIKALNQKRDSLFDKVEAVNDELARLVEYEQRKVFSAFKKVVSAEAIALYARDTAPALDLPPQQANTTNRKKTS